MRKTLLLLPVFLTLALTSPQTTQTIIATNYSQVTAHRGSSADAPENTLGAFRQAMLDHAGYAELDVQETADGVVMLMHDDNALRTTGLDKNMWEVTSTELKQVSAGSWFHKDFKDETVPTLDEVISLVKGHMRLNIELKNNGHGVGLAQKTVDLIQAHDFVKECTVTSFDVNLLHTVKALNSSIKTGLIVSQKTENVEESMKSADFDVISAAYPIVNESFVKMAEDHHKEVYVWTVNDARMMKRMLALGVSSIITNEPAKLVNLMSSE
ncbi:glycerophosphodiester phosphodiesterase [Paenibacillus roseipurpureus]|uniref:Glycerophosphodiester phosphodiesterase family protein n=1 Tax=Paenibacillus roseopurpureus TaxID=2918901 RepID=A0AA96LSB9_9BACL|nr:glycerophosphodiester phosphodiesterase family protein [Paenibacillus sp. MBLB1832]WNR46364.1 glycerophosphodiester phosphodiesterase family protein [Paenibacillus sp. MBLB1832]